jgi:hypothetical protein
MYSGYTAKLKGKVKDTEKAKPSEVDAPQRGKRMPFKAKEHKGKGKSTHKSRFDV